MRFIWIPESITSPVVYAPKNYNEDNTPTSDFRKAIHFLTKKECKEWCLNNPNPQYIPVEHGFVEEVN